MVGWRWRTREPRVGAVTNCSCLRLNCILGACWSVLFPKLDVGQFGFHLTGPMLWTNRMWEFEKHELWAVHSEYRLTGLVVRRPPREWKILGSNPTYDGIFLGSSHTNDLKIGSPVATLPGAWHYRVSAGNGWPGVIVLWLGEMESLICNFYLSVAARKIVWGDPSLRYTRMLLRR